MTDLVTRHEADGASADKPASTGDTGVPGDDVTYEWAPAEPAKRKRHLGLWIGIPAAVAVVALAVASTLLIAPGTAVAGVGVGGMTQGAATEAIAQRLAQTSIQVAGPAGDVSLTAADLGATVDAGVLAQRAFDDHPAWKVTDWFGAASPAPISVDEATATAALRAALPALYTDPINAAIAFDAATGYYSVTPAVDGQGLDVATVTAALQDAFDAGRTSAEIEPTVVTVAAPGTTAAAQQTADQLNTMLDTVGFYVGDERTVPIERAVAASWLTVDTAADGTISVTADPALIQPVVDTLPGVIDRAPVNASVITDTAGKVLSTSTAGVDGRAVGDVSGAANAFAEQLGSMNGQYAVPVSTTPFTTTSVARSIVVDLSEQRTYLYENGAVVNSYLVSTGKAGTPTHTGNFRINSHVRIQNMGCVPSVDYCTPDVPWVMYFNGDQGFHGTYWHNNFGRTMSHGCVNLPVDTARALYSWAPNGVEVKVQN